MMTKKIRTIKIMMIIIMIMIIIIKVKDDHQKKKILNINNLQIHKKFLFKLLILNIFILLTIISVD